MGGLEDFEPPLKRIKESSGESESSSCISPTFTSLAEMATALPSLGDGDDIIGSRNVIRKDEFVKIITSELYSLGYDKTGALLEEESGLSLHSPSVTSLIQCVLDGRWDGSIKILREIGIPVEIEKSASFIILEQKYLEHLLNGNTKDALSTLRYEISPLCIDVERVCELSSYLITHSQSTTTDTKIHMSSRSDVLVKLQKVFPVGVIIPERRLEHLVEQALDLQLEFCTFHNSLDQLSLYTDHQCGITRIPSETLQVLEGHSDEIWYVQFSHNGKYLASASKDLSAIVWEVQDSGLLSLKHRLFGHQTSVVIVVWNSDDSQLLTCGTQEAVRRWDVQSGECLHVYAMNDVGLVSCGWFHDGKRIFSGMTDMSICIWDLDGLEVECLKGQKTAMISDLAITNDGRKIISICQENAILLLEREANLERVYEEDHNITSFALSKDSKFLLVNLDNQEIHLWSLEGDIKIVSKYRGHKRSRFIIRSCFGGVDEAFIASGSEDSQVYIWHRSTGDPLFALRGHSGVVNSVSWSPSNPHILASAGDDRTIRIWGLAHNNRK